jgi:hypothetical protein
LPFPELEQRFPVLEQRFPVLEQRFPVLEQRFPVSAFAALSWVAMSGELGRQSEPPARSPKAACRKSTLLLVS